MNGGSGNTATFFSANSTLEFVTSDTDGTLNYTIPPTGGGSGDAPRVDIFISEFYNARLNGLNAVDAGLEASIGMVEWDDNGVISVRGIISGPFAPGNDIPLADFQDVGISEDDQIIGTDLNDVFDGGTGDDNIRGGVANDVLFGEEGNDTILGDLGDDILDGGIGNDRLFGGNNSDIFVFSSGYDFDRILDFQNNRDNIDLTGFAFADYDAVVALMDEVGGNIVIDFGGGDILQINDLTIAELDAGNFIL